MARVYHEFLKFMSVWEPSPILQKGFIWTSGGILLVTALGKAAASVGYSGILLEPAPLFSFLTYQQLLIGATLVELLVVVSIICFLPIAKGIWTITGLATVFIVYRGGVWLIGYDRPCGCLGSLVQALPISEQAASSIMIGVLAYLWLGGSALTIGRRTSRRRSLQATKENACFQHKNKSMSVISVLILLGVLPMPIAATEIGARETDNGPLVRFKRFLSDPPPIRRIEFSLSGNRFGFYTADGKEISAAKQVRLEGALLEGTWYGKRVANFPKSIVEMGNGSVVGQSRKAAWYMESNKRVVYVGPKVDDQRLTSLKGPAKRAYNMKQRIRDVRALGLGHAVPGTIEWAGKLSFEGKSWRGARIEGKIERLSANFPQSLQYSIEDRDHGMHKVIYNYNSKFRIPPKTTIIQVFKEDVLLQARTNVIHDISVAAKDNEQEGFKPCDFRPADEPVARLMVFTNGAMVRFTPDGDVERKQDSEHTDSLFAPITLFGIAFVGGLIATCRQWNGNGYDNTNKKVWKE